MKAYILKLSFKGIQPEVWRRVIIPAGATFNRLHETIQYVTNFKSYLEPYHSFCFPLEDAIITNSEELIGQKEVDGKKVKRPTRIKIDQYIEETGEMIYQYDFGDQWEIAITLEDTVDDYYFGYPTLLDGGGMAPPEDVGGPAGYMKFLEIIHDPTHPQYTSSREWAESMGYKPLNMDQINALLKNVKFKKTEWEHIHHENYIVISDKYRGSEVIDPEQVTNKDLIFDYIVSCTNLYGIVPYYKVIQIYNLQNKPKITNKDLLAIATDSRYKKQLEESNVVIKLDRFVHKSLEESKATEKLEQYVIGKPFYIPEKEELLKYKDEFYYEKTKYHRELARLLEKIERTENRPVQEMIDELVWKMRIKNYQFNITMKEFLNLFAFEDMNQVNEVTRMIFTVANTTRLWDNRGYTPKELADLSKPKQTKIVAGAKIGRNDPCHCGSGKKYKKCCGR
ncbi:SEC-C metal-binding domain-containing protein [Ureibacillus sp. FSL K6-8385]|uniref:IS1096 element passenger TnpR family protein n=1 Tax=Ureibacillus TaxID=160795 RepID=UPI002E1F48B7|nr:SEC-C metal-binding domain-containing protein [Ureibacillus terrenus]